MLDQLKAVLRGRSVPPQQAILEILVRGENYGLGIRDAIRERTGVEIGPGTLYPALHALERDGLLEAREADPSAERGGRPKVYYRLSALGVRAALDIREQMSGLYGLEGSHVG
jgi:PadR family transcriptional regulator